MPIQKLSNIHTEYSNIYSHKAYKTNMKKKNTKQEKIESEIVVWIFKCIYVCRMWVGRFVYKKESERENRK